MIEKHFDIPFIADLALREKQIQQNYRPIIAVHKWFARRPGTLFRGLLLSEFSDARLRETFYSPNTFTGIHIADPFMGGGTPLLEANRLGCNITGFDINPMAYWIVKQEIEHLDLILYTNKANSITDKLEKEIGKLYRTRCVICGADALVKYFLWVKVIQCRNCHQDIDLFPGYLLAADTRHPRNVFVCRICGQLTETGDRSRPGKCQHCGAGLSLDGPASRNRCQCPYCGIVNSFPDEKSGPPRHRLFAIEYHCFKCRDIHTGRFFKAPDEQDLAIVTLSEDTWAKTHPNFVPDNVIPSGDETNRLLRWGYRHYREMFNSRQLLGLETLAGLIAATEDERVRNALATNLSDLLRYQNMLCRYDTKALKSLDIFSIHGFPVGLIQCESNFIGIWDTVRNVCIGSGGWINIVDKFRKAKAYCESPFEVKHHNQRKEIVPIKGEWIGDHPNSKNQGPARAVNLKCEDAGQADLPASSLDAVFTDPPYFGNVQYAELMDFCYVWLRKLVDIKKEGAFRAETTRNRQELTGNDDMGRGLEHFTEGLSAVFQRMAKALKAGAPLAFTYHHNSMKAYHPVAIAVLDAGLTCSASLPCPAEMGASIHINGTGSSIIDTIFVCRTTGTVPKKWIASSTVDVANLVMEDLAKLQNGNVKASWGDTRCIAYGHLIRLAIWHLRKDWNKNAELNAKFFTLEEWFRHFGEWPEVEEHLKYLWDSRRTKIQPAVRENIEEYGDEYVSF